MDAVALGIWLQRRSKYARATFLSIGTAPLPDGFVAFPYCQQPKPQVARHHLLGLSALDLWLTISLSRTGRAAAQTISRTAGGANLFAGKTYQLLINSSASTSVN
jgi:hypothetical protein